MSVFFNRLNYSFGNEDWQTEQKALNIQPDDCIVSITASGDRPLNLLINDCKKIYSIDMNRHQNALLELKMAAMKTFDYEDYLDFLHGKKGSIHDLSSHLDKEQYEYWFKNKKRIEKGILYQGSMEKWSSIISFLIKMLRKKKVKQLFSFDDVEKQKEFVQKEWDTPCWRKSFEIVLHPTISRYIFKDPGLADFCDRSLNVGQYICSRMNYNLSTRLAKENLLASLVIKGSVNPAAYPPYLKEDGVSAIRSRLDKVTTKTANIIEFLESAEENSFDVFSLSDVSSYLSESDFHRLARAVVRSAKPNSRFCLRQFLSYHKIPDDIKPYFQRDLSLEKSLEERDNCFVYRFFAGTIKKG